MHIRNTLCKPISQIPSSWLASVYLPSCHHLDSVLTVPPLVLASLDWWQDTLMVCTGIPFARPQPLISLVSDVSERGCGAHLGHLRTQGLSFHEELLLHSNVRELRAILLLSGVLAPHCEQVRAIAHDNMAAMYYLSRQGRARSSPSGSYLLMGVLHNALNSPQSFSPSGAQNELADHLSMSSPVIMSGTL